MSQTEIWKPKTCAYLIPCQISCSVQVDVLIGADHYYSFVTGIYKRGENLESLVAVESHFGWILTGPVDSYSKHAAMLTMVENNEVTASLESIGKEGKVGRTICIRSLT